MKASEYHDIGQYLRDSRESLHISVEEAAHALHIRPKYIKALETGELKELPGKAYIRGYIRNYAEFLRLDSAEALEAYESLLLHRDRDFFIPEPSLRQNLPTKNIVKWSLIGVFLLYGYWYFVIHDRTPVDLSVASLPDEFVQMLDKTAQTAMDRAWRQCLNGDDSGCFVTLKLDTEIPHDTIVNYDSIFPHTPPQKP